MDNIRLLRGKSDKFLCPYCKMDNSEAESPRAERLLNVASKTRGYINACQYQVHILARWRERGGGEAEI
jgi:hypothetical protein